MSVLEIRDEGHVRTLTLSRAEFANALSDELVDELIRATGPDALSGVGILELHGSSRHFCAGLDLADLDSLDDATAVRRVLRIAYLLEQLYAAPCLTLAHAQGAAVGAGADLFAACDVRVAGPHATFRFPGAGFDLVLGTRRLAELVGSATALEWVGSGRRIERAVALDAGLVSTDDETVPTSIRRVTAQTAAALSSAARPAKPRFIGLGEAAASLLEPGLADRIRAFAKGVSS